MIVLFNVKITNIRMGYPYHRGEWTPNDDRFDVFKYTLASMAVLDPLVKKYIFCVTLSQEYEHRFDELKEYIYSLFPADKVSIEPRCDYGRDWRRICDQYLTNPDELIWLACNDDHVFIDSSIDTVASGIKALQEDPNPDAVMYYSHWPEQMRMSKQLNGTLTADGDFIRYEWENFDGIMILKAGRLTKYWDREYGDIPMFKVDYLGAFHGYKCPGPIYAPTRELVRHYEGYSHVNHGMEQTLANTCPPLFIPPGFFDNNITIRIGYTERDNSCTNFNPSAAQLYNVESVVGTDYRWVEEDIPLFWRNRVKTIDYNPEYDKQQGYIERDRAFIDITHASMCCFNIRFDHTNAAPEEWFSKHLLAK